MEKSIHNIRQLIDSGNLDEAERALTVALEQNPGSEEMLKLRTEISFRFGSFLWDEGDVEEALDYLTRALEADPSDRTVVLKCGEVLSALEQHDAAKNLYSTFLQKNPADEEISEALRSLPAYVEEAGHKDKEIRVSAIVSTYNSERFMRGCLEDLVSQTLYKRGELEIIVIDSGSEENEKAIVEEFQKTFENIIYVRTKRETVYAAWNRGIKLASGKYITNANTDDRHRYDSLEVMAEKLDRNPDIGLVYADVIITEKENETFENHTPAGAFRWLDFSRELLSIGCFMGPQPMWRKSLHDKYGYFDESFTSSGDWEFWLRIADRTEMLHVPEFLGLYLYSPSSAEHRNHGKRRSEDVRVQQQYIPRYLSTAEDMERGLAKIDEMTQKTGDPRPVAGIKNILTQLKSGKADRSPGHTVPFEQDIARTASAVTASIARTKKSFSGKATPSPAARKKDYCSLILLISLQNGSLSTCLENIKKYTPEPHEVIFVPADGKHGVTKHIRKQVKRNQNYSMIQNTLKLSYPQACNMGISKAKGEYVVILNDGVIVTEGWLAGMLECLRMEKDAGIVGPMTDNCEGQQRVEKTETDRALLRLMETEGRLEEYAKAFRERNRNRRVPAKTLDSFCILFKNELNEKLGLFDEGFESGTYAVKDYCLRAGLEGLRNLIAGDVFVHCHDHPSLSEREDEISFGEKWGSHDPKPESKVFSDPALFSLAGNEKSVVPPISDLTSIVIQVHNRWYQTELCLKSIEEHTPEPHEIIVVDNGSKDETGERLWELVTKSVNITPSPLPSPARGEGITSGRSSLMGEGTMAAPSPAGDEQKGPSPPLKGGDKGDNVIFASGLRVIQNNANRGYAAGMNQGISIARGEYILLLSNDAVVTPGWLGRMKKLFNLYPKTGIAGPMSNDVTPPQLADKVDYADTADIGDFAVRWSEEHEGRSFSATKASGFCLLTGRKVIDAIGGMDEQFGTGNFEDDDFCYRAFLTGFEIRIAQDVFIHSEARQPFIKEEGVDYNAKIARNWELFKAKWEIPKNTPMDRCWIPARIPDSTSHFFPLPNLSSDHLPDPEYRWWEEMTEQKQKEAEKETEKEKKERTKDLTSIIVLISESREYPRRCVESIRSHTKEPHELIFIARDDSYASPKWLRRMLKENRNYRLVTPEKKTKARVVADPDEKRSSSRPGPAVKRQYSRYVEPWSPPPKPSGGHLSYAQAVNRGISASSGEHIAIIRDNTVVAEEWLAGMLECLNSSPDTGIIGPMATNIEGPQRVVCGEETETRRESFRLVETEGKDETNGDRKRTGSTPPLRGGDKGEGETLSEDHPHPRIEYGAGSNPPPSMGREVTSSPASSSLIQSHLDTYAKAFRERNRYRRVPVKTLDSSGILFRYALAEKSGVFDEDFSTGVHAVDDYCLRAAVEGFRNMIAGDVLINCYGERALPALKDRIAFSRKWGDVNNPKQESKKIYSATAVFLADELNQKGQRDKAVLTLVEAIKSFPDEKRLHYALAESLIEEKKFQEAFDFLERMPGGYIKDAEKLELMGYCREGLGLLEEAEQYANEIILLNNNSAKAWNLRGAVAFRKNLNADAERFFNRAIEADMGFGEAYSNLGALRWMAGNREEAFKLFERAFILSPTSGDIVTNYYTAAVSLSKLQEAEEIFKEAVSLHPVNRRLQFILIDNLLQQKKFDEAMHRMEEALITFGIDDETLAVALKLRESVGPMEIGKADTNRDSSRLMDNNSPLEKGDKGGCSSLNEKLLEPGVDKIEKEIISKQPPAPPLLRGNKTADSSASHGVPVEKYSTPPLTGGDKGEGETSAEDHPHPRIECGAGSDPPPSMGREVSSFPSLNQSQSVSISLCMIVKNEEKNIAAALRSVKPVVDEMIVVDTGSTDRTKTIAKVFGAKVYDFPWNDDFSEARNFSISKASGDWILVLDADEVISPADYGKLRELVETVRTETRRAPNEPSVMLNSFQHLAGGTGHRDEILKQVQDDKKHTGPSDTLKQDKDDGNRLFQQPSDPPVSNSLHQSPNLNESQSVSSYKVAYAFATRNYVGPVSVDWRPNEGQYREEGGSGWFPSVKARLFPNDNRIRFEKPVHETVEDSLMRSGIELRECSIPIHHYGKLDKEGVIAKGEAYYQLGKKKLAEKGERDPNALYELAVQATELEKYEEAVQYWEKLLAIRPDISKAHYRMGNCLYHLERYEEALEAFKTAVRIEPDSKDPGVMYATCELIAGNAEAAVLLLERLLGKEPGYPLALLGLVAAYYCSGRRDRGFECIGQVEKTPFSIAQYLNDMAELLIRAGRFDYARRLLEAALETGNTTGETPGLLDSIKNKETDGDSSRLMETQRKDETHGDSMETNGDREKTLSTPPSRGGDKGEGEVTAPPPPAPSPLKGEGIMEKTTPSIRGRESSPVSANLNKSQPVSISLCMIVKNEEENIERALLSVKPVVDEMIVVDTGSTDRTKEIAAALGAKVYDFPWTDDFAEARNFSLSKATGDWILVLDADEVISPLDHAKLRELVEIKKETYGD